MSTDNFKKFLPIYIDDQNAIWHRLDEYDDRIENPELLKDMLLFLRDYVRDMSFRMAAIEEHLSRCEIQQPNLERFKSLTEHINELARIKREQWWVAKQSKDTKLSV